MVQGNTTENGAQSDIMLKKALIERKLEETGEKARLEEYLRQRLIESGWRDDLKRHCLGKLSPFWFSIKLTSFLTLFVLLEIIRAKGLERINLEDLVEELLPRGRSLVPTSVKEDLLGQIKLFLENDSDYRRLSGFWFSYAIFNRKFELLLTLFLTEKNHNNSS